VGAFCVWGLRIMRGGGIPGRFKKRGFMTSKTEQCPEKQDGVWKDVKEKGRRTSER
jgi:hypothetical protein